MSSRVIKRVTQHLSVQVTRSLRKSFRAGFCDKPESWEEQPNCRDLPNLEVATGDPVRTAIERYCKSRRIRTESRQVAETTIHNQQKLRRLGLQLVIGTLESVHWGFAIGLLGDLEQDWLCTLRVGLQQHSGGNCALIPVLGRIVSRETYS